MSTSPLGRRHDLGPSRHPTRISLAWHSLTLPLVCLCVLSALCSHHQHGAPASPAEATIAYPCAICELNPTGPGQFRARQGTGYAREEAPAARALQPELVRWSINYGGRCKPCEYAKKTPSHTYRAIDPSLVRSRADSGPLSRDCDATRSSRRGLAPPAAQVTGSD